MNWHDCYSINGFHPEHYYIEQFGMKPKNRVVFNFDYEKSTIDNEKLTDEFVYMLIPDTVRIFRSCALQKEESKDTEYLNSAGWLYITTPTKFWYIDYNSITCYSEEDIEILKKQVEELALKLPIKVSEPKTKEIEFIAYSEGSYYTITRDLSDSIQPTNVEENYNDDFLPVYDRLGKFLTEDETGLVLLYGECGTGKTSIIYDLISKYPNHYIIVPSLLSTRIAEPEFITFLMAYSDSVFILEDCEQLLMDREDIGPNSGISAILNMSDGLAAKACNIKFICTFNADIDKIDSALLRKGRCKAKYEFTKLDKEKVDALNKKYNLGLKKIEPLTLAEIYNADESDYSENKSIKKIGF